MNTEEILFELATARKLPVEAIGAAQARFDETGPLFRSLLERAATGDVLNEGEASILFFAVHILAARRDTQSFGALLRFATLPEEDVEFMLGDAFTETLSAIVADLFDGDAQALFAAIEDPATGEWVGMSLIYAAALLAFEGRIARDRIALFLERFDDEKLADPLSAAWLAWANSIALLGMRALAARVEAAIADGRIDPTNLSGRDFANDLARSEREPKDPGLFVKIVGRLHVDDVAATLSGYQNVGNDDDACEGDTLLPVGEIDDETEKALVEEVTGRPLSDLPPIEGYLHELATARVLPQRAVMQCTLRFAQSRPALRAVLARVADDESFREADADLFFRGIHILGGRRDRASCRALLKFLRRPERDVDRYLGYAITETLNHIVAGVFDGGAEALFAAAIQPGEFEFVSLEIVRAATFLTFDRKIPLQTMVQFLERFDDERPAPAGAPIWTGWAQAIALLGLRDHLPRVEAAFKDERIDDLSIGRKDILKDLALAERKPNDVGRFKKLNYGYIDDIIVELERVDRLDEDEGVFADDEDPMRWAEPGVPPSGPPHVNPLRHVGRNDPCPCGSGKKFKKCCLGKSDL